MPLKPGDRIERYVIDGLLGSGGMGDVYRAHDSRLKRGVALKILHAEPAADPNKSSSPASSAAARMMREAQLAAALDHPNVVAIFDVGQIEQPAELRGTTYLAMELIRGEPLRKYIGDPSVRMKTRVRWLEEIARALGAAHAAGLVHRDVKPENVMIREDGIVKVLDFGIAKRTIAAPIDPTSSTEGFAIPTMTAQGVVVGTPLYMAPEQLRAEPLDGRVDQFAWGVVAYELLTGRQLWSLEGGGFSLVAQILQAPPPSLAAFPGVTPRVAGVVARALAKDPAARFPTMDALLEELCGKADAGDTEPKIPLLPSTPGPVEKRLSETPTQAIVNRGEASTPPGHINTQRSALEDERLSTTKRSEPPPPATRSRAMVASLVTLGLAAALAMALGRARQRNPAAGSASASPAIDAPVAGCKSHRECVEANGGAPSICRAADRRCIAVGSPECVAKIEPNEVRSEDTVWFGALIPLSGQRGDSYGKETGSVLDLARRDFASVGGLPGVREGTTRPVGLILCDSEARQAAAAHLVDLEVPVVLGLHAPVKEAIELATTMFFPKRMLILDFYDTSPLITRIPQPADTPRLVWRLTANAAQSGEALAHVASELVEPALRRAAIVTDERPIRIAAVRSDGSTEKSTMEAFVANLTMNGKPVVENGARFKQLTWQGARPSPGDVESIRAALVELAPHVIAYADGEFFEGAFLRSLEEQWRAPYRPTYLSVALLSGTDLVAFVGKNASRRRRFVDVDLPANTEQNLEFVLHYNESYSPKITPGEAPGGPYDAFYVAAYATATVRKERVSGIDVALAMARLGGDGTPVSVGPSRIFDAYATLRDGKSLHVVGAGSQLDFDHEHGEIPSDFAVYCLDVDDQGRASSQIESGIRYDHRLRHLVGTSGCP